MTNEQLTELGEALSILSAKSSVLKEREELAQLIKEVSSTAEATEESAAAAPSSPKADADKPAAKEEASASEKTEASSSSSASTRSMTKRIKSMLEKIDNQLEEYDRDVGSRMNLIETSATGKISVDDLEQALRLIKHKPEDEVIEKIVDKLDVDHDGLVPLDDVLELAQAETGWVSCGTKVSSRFTLRARRSAMAMHLSLRRATLSRTERLPSIAILPSPLFYTCHIQRRLISHFQHHHHHHYYTSKYS